MHQKAWAEAINRAYDAGIFIVTAAGNNYGNMPTRKIVYPAGFDRVVAACGVQAIKGSGYTPYADLALTLMAGNYGPPNKAKYALAAFTPNVPWARINSGAIVDFDGGGTSSATPQVAATAALWIAKNRKKLEKYDHLWQRIEATRAALFSSADAPGAEHYGNGVLKANGALAVAPAKASRLKKRRRDKAGWSIVKLFGGFSAAGSEKTRKIEVEMLDIELAQLAQRIPELAELVGDADEPDDDGAILSQIAEILQNETDVSETLRGVLKRATPQKPEHVPEDSEVDRGLLADQRLENALDPPVAQPTHRNLRIYSSDPAATTIAGNRELAQTVVSLPWSPIARGPIDEYLEIIDIDPASGACYAPADLNHPAILAQDGLEPSESDPRFHQQMVYAVARKTIGHFEEALGRVALWSAKLVRRDGKYDDRFVRRLRIYPHALREANAYYSPSKKALLFGYFTEPEGMERGLAPNSTVFTCLSYDIIAHETSHALLDGLHPRFAEAGSDMRAFHEAFSDMVALFQHFTHHDALRDSIRRSETKTNFDHMLTSLAVQFGRSLEGRSALRSALGRRWDERLGKDVPMTVLNTQSEPHERGAVLVAAVFDAFLDIYQRRSADLMRIATGGTGVMPDGEMPPDLVNRLAREASKTAGHILRMVIRALDYCPPVDITFGDYLRAMITGDLDLAPVDSYDYRTSVVSAFRNRGIHPDNVTSISPDSLRWESPEIRDFDLLPFIEDNFLNEKNFKWTLESDRLEAYRGSKSAAGKLNLWLKKVFGERPNGHEECLHLGFSLERKPETRPLGQEGKLSPFEVHSVRPARRIDTSDQEQLDIIIEITQKMDCQER